MIYKKDPSGAYVPFYMNLGTPLGGEELSTFIYELKNHGTGVVNILPHVESYRLLEGPEQPVRFLNFIINKTILDSLDKATQDMLMLGHSMVYLNAMGSGLFKIVSRRMEEHVYTITAYGVEAELYDYQIPGTISGTPQSIAIGLCTPNSGWDALSKYGFTVDTDEGQSWNGAVATIEGGYNSLSLLYICSLADDAFAFFYDDKLCYKKFNDDKKIVGQIASNSNSKLDGVLDVYPRIGDVISKTDLMMYHRVVKLVSSTNDNLSSIINYQVVHTRLDGDLTFDARPPRENEPTNEVWVDVTKLFAVGGSVVEPIYYQVPVIDSYTTDGNYCDIYSKGKNIGTLNFPKSEIHKRTVRNIITMPYDFTAIYVDVEYNRARGDLNIMLRNRTTGHTVDKDVFVGERNTHEDSRGITTLSFENERNPSGQYEVVITPISCGGRYESYIRLSTRTTEVLAESNLTVWDTYRATDPYPNSNDYDNKITFSDVGQIKMDVVSMVWDLVSEYRVEKEENAIVITKITGAQINTNTKPTLVEPTNNRCRFSATSASTYNTNLQSISRYGPHNGPPIRLNNIITVNDVIPKDIARNAVKRYKDPSKSSVISMKEAEITICDDGEVRTVWSPSFEPFGFVKKLEDRINGTIFVNKHDCDGEHDNSLLKISTVRYLYPECIAEYTFGLTRNTDIIQEISNLQQKDN